MMENPIENPIEMDDVGPKIHTRAYENPMKLDDLGPRGTPPFYEASISVMALVVMN